MEDEEKKLDFRDMGDLYRAFEQADHILMKKYQYTLAGYQVCDLPDALLQEGRGGNFQFFRIARIVYDQDENTLDKLTTVYHSLTPYGDSTVLMLLVGIKEGVDLYCGVAYRGETNTAERGKRYKTLKDTMQSNFPGIEMQSVMVNGEKGPTNQQLLEKIFENAQAVSAVSGVAAQRREKTDKNEAFVQGIEKLVDTMRGKRYAAIFIADCVPVTEVEKICIDYEDIYSQLSPFLQSQQSVGKSAGTTDTDSVIQGITDTTNRSTTRSVSHGKSEGSFRSNSIGGGVNVGTKLNVVDVSASVNYNHASGENVGTTYNETEGETSGTAQSLTKQNSVAKSLASSDTESLQITFQNRAVKTLLDRIDEQIKRLRSCEDFGVYDFGAYFVAEETTVAVEAAATYQALMRGENSSAEASAINTWYEEPAKQVVEFLRRMAHPQIAVPDLSIEGKLVSEEDGTEKKEYSWLPLTPSSLVSGRELSIHMGLPKKSVPGVAVIPCTEFGREVLTYDMTQTAELNIDLGKIVHMRHEEDRPVRLNPKSLTAHTFITGSTGAGKSNTIYTMLDGLRKLNDVHFLVVEPAKGEYKDIFGGEEDVSVWGTNPCKAPLLRINPFSFPEDIHVLEHIDRLVEIFNACWPMYAAMPAILKEAIENSYRKCGWSMTKSIRGTRSFPTFSDLLEELPRVIESSAYSSDTSSDYKGALITRVRSLTTGIYGQIFCSGDEISSGDLFDKNVIVDLSRVGSMETKSLLMGILVMKLQEYRMAQGGMNSELKHITVLEEAHNLLRRTSTEQSQESSNLQGKSVEMLANAIAEMRTYGEGFIIADQSPGLLDLSVIRNTNTKIIMRLPDASDRELVGRAAGLNDSQITELSKLERGVAAVYQNDWIEPVLCKVLRFPDEKMCPFDFCNQDVVDSELQKAKELVFENIFCDENNEISKEHIDAIRRWSASMNIGRATYALLERVLFQPREGTESLSDREKKILAYNLFEGKRLATDFADVTSQQDGERILQQLQENLDLNRRLICQICQLVLEQADELRPALELSPRMERLGLWNRRRI